ncbi:hypothetical protein PoB_003440300 [Plakobranchus ocellatus]|uniref:Uncharacterized protein n=1 Tax=Plakobranchus ocellatus TaxID=259542 RepID=A0AAV4AKR9_9GAST|nr:hypothetical protein PoB_003440300 [Plakobranchus ocellatus]
MTVVWKYCEINSTIGSKYIRQANVKRVDSKAITEAIRRVERKDDGSLGDDAKDLSRSAVHFYVKKCRTGR